MKRWELETAHGKLQTAHAALLAERGALQARISDLELAVRQGLERTAKLEEQLREALRSTGKFRRDPARQRGEPKHPGRRKGEGEWSRRTAPTEEEQSAATEKSAPLDCCPDCKGAVTDLETRISHEVDIPPVQPVWTVYKTESGYCANCRKRVQSRHPEQISTATGAAGVHVGPQAKALASDMKHRLGLSYEKVAGLMQTQFGLPVTRSGLYQADIRLARQARPVYQDLVEQLQDVLQLHVDETGWRIGTVAAWLWIFCGKGISVFAIRASRGHEVILDVLGREFKGHLTSDGALAYEAKPLRDWLKQKCVAHILRNLAKLSDNAVAGHMQLAVEATAVLKDALALARSRGDLPDDDYARRVQAIEDRMDAVIATHIGVDDDDGQRMARHLAKHRQHLFPFLHVANLEATNNPAERGLRPAIAPRKTGGCNRTEGGAEAHAILASISATCRSRKIDVISFLVRLQRDLSTSSLPATASGPAG